jgi:hypothetical protein
MRVDQGGKVYLRGGGSSAAAAATETNAQRRRRRQGRDDDETKSSPGKKDGAPARKAAAAITLTRDSGRVGLQLYSRTVPVMQELSLVDGFVKLYDSFTPPGYSASKDVLLRVRGVLIHGTGQLSLVSANTPVGRSALVVVPPGTTTADNKRRRRRRLLQELVENNLSDVDIVRESVLDLYPAEQQDTAELGTPKELLVTRDELGDTAEREEEEEEATEEPTDSVDGEIMTRTSVSRKILEVHSAEQVNSKEDEGQGDKEEAEEVKDAKLPPWSDVVIPYPYVRDDEDETIRRTRTPASRMMPPREQSLEANAAGCEFEINLTVEAVEWTVGAWRKLMAGRVEEAKRLDPERRREDGDESEKDNGNRKGAFFSSGSPSSRSRRLKKPVQDQALVMNIVGSMHSENCDFTAVLNATAFRTDWDATTNKAINYSFYMMLVCLTQILVLLRQLLHSQSQSTAIRVSLLCIGWQTVIDALLCLAHIYLSLAVQPLFTAFASVAFFKLLIFCVIEMKYMAIIIQARNSSNGGQPTDVLRRQVAMLHLRFYVALLASFLLMFYVGDRYRVVYMLALYSFWVPQIIMNIVSEAKAPMHTYYIYGMSLTRLVAPLYLYALPNNFLKEVYPESPSDPYMCQLLVLWVGCQTAILIAQGKYGARFMIPARFLPPKFDYSRPIPASMLPPGALELQGSESMEDRGDALRAAPRAGALSTTEPLKPRGRHTTAATTRSRIRGKRANRSETTMTTETHTPPAAPPPAAFTLECSICYDAIDVRNRPDYMLAPCNHLFHRECLAQWMDVKMECPICRTELPAL